MSCYRIVASAVVLAETLWQRVVDEFESLTCSAMKVVPLMCCAHPLTSMCCSCRGSRMPSAPAVAGGRLPAEGSTAKHLEFGTAQCGSLWPRWTDIYGRCRRRAVHRLDRAATDAGGYILILLPFIAFIAFDYLLYYQHTADSGVRICGSQILLSLKT